MRRVLVAAALLASRVALAAPIRFDARAPFQEPLVTATIAGQRQALLVDSGSPEHVWSLKRARLSGVSFPLVDELHDFAMRAHPVSRARVPVLLDGLSGAFASAVVSRWTDALQGQRPPSLPRIDGVISPQKLAGDDRAVVLDFVRGEVALTDWSDAIVRVTEPELAAVADVPATASGHFVVRARVGGEWLRLAIDTGATSSALYAPARDDHPSGAVRHWARTARLVLGPLVRDLAFDVIEPLADPGFDGLIGMDVLRECALAIDRKHLALRCRDDHSHPEMSASVVAPRERGPLARERLLVGDGVEARELANGDVRFEGDRVIVTFHPDGRLDVSERARPNELAMRSARDERDWLLDETRAFRYEVAHAWALRHSFDFLPRHLRAVWSDPRYSIELRREILFELWDEAAEPDDPELGEAGRRARRVIERFVRASLPAGSPVAFSDEELAHMNARRARGPRFDPYHPDPLDDRAGDFSAP